MPINPPVTRPAGDVDEKFAPVTFALRRVVPLKVAEVKLAFETLAPDRSIPERSAFERFAPGPTRNPLLTDQPMGSRVVLDDVTFEAMTPVRFAPERFAPEMFAQLRSRFERLADPKLTFCKSAPGPTKVPFIDAAKLVTQLGVDPDAYVVFVRM